MDSRDRDRVVLAAVVFAVLFSQLLLYPGIATLVSALGAEATTSPFAETALDASMWFLVAEFAAYVAFVGVWGAVSDVTGKRTPLIVAGAVAGATGYGLLALVPTIGSIPFEGVLLLRVFQGAMTIGALSLTMTMLMDLGGGNGRNMGAAGIAIGLGAALGAPVGGQLTEIHPLAPLVAATTLLLCVGALVTAVTDRAPTRRRSAGALLEGVRRQPTLSIPYAFGFVDRMTAGFFALVGTLYFQETFGLDAGTTGLLLACFFAPFALLQYPMGALSDRIGRTIPIVVGSICYGFGILAVGSAPTVVLAAVAMIAIGVLGALVSPTTMALVTDIADESERGLAMAGFNLAGSLGFLGGFLIGGTVAGSYGYDLAFLVVGGLEVAIAVVATPAFLRLSLGSSSEGRKRDVRP
ncbi:MFS transporter [Natronobacterium gregoryi]|uniref:MFS transporter n=2 Tax=Natronobacterium gregoryi TaxID=44930 RepID=L0AG97_NATGS|nr:MFS transporter [Natronobacterium gregoryi]AFZ72948.1 sugar phosphate permease [Natronobacterium gregoryi SP2]PLK21827.1 MFS transporter [Natronobacterium gregoryi SP2]SFI68288.1 Major Facilitator Superfamily protein [Natronobacterium gregoryi]